MLLVWVLLELVAAAQAPAQRGSVLQSWLQGVGAPVLWVARGLASGVSDLAWGSRNLRDVVAEHQRLRLELDRCRAREAALRAELGMLRSALPLASATLEETAGGIIVSCRYRDLSRGVLQVAGGLRDGLRRDQPVLGVEGVVGRVWRVGASVSWVELLTGPSAAAAVRTPDGSIHGLAEGDGAGGLRVRFIPRTAQLLVGSILVTSGADGLYPGGLTVGRVLSARETGGDFLEVTAAPTVDLQNLKTSLVLTGWKSEGLP